MEDRRSTSAYEFSKRKVLLFFTLTTSLLVINLLLVEQNRAMKAQVNKPDRTLELTPGKDLPPIRGIDMNGNELTLEYGQDARKTLLLVFSPGCRACKDNMPAWQAFLKRLNKNAFRPMAISLKQEGVKAYAAEYDFTDIPIVSEIDAKVRVAYGLVLTPQTILIGADGKAEKVWTGLLGPDEKLEIERSLGL